MIKAPSSFKKEQLIFENWRNFLQSEDVEPTAWLQMVKENYEAILKEDPLNEDLMEEGVWSKIKYYMGKLGSIEKGGKVFGRKKRTKAAEEKLAAAIEKAAQKGFADFRNDIESEFPEFPNMEKKEDFVNALMNIGAVYDSVDAAVAKYDEQGAEVKGGLDPDSANALVSALREYVAFLLDYKLADSYKHFTENKDRIDEAPPPVGGVARVGGGERRQPAGVSGRAAGTGTPEGPKGTYTKRGAQGAAVDSETIKGLESNVFPALLALSGLAGILAGTLLKTAWFKGLVTETVPGQDLVQKGMVDEDALQAMQTSLTPEPGEGASQMLGRVLEGNPDAFGPDAPVSDMLDAMKERGVTPQDLAELSGNPEQFMTAWEEALASGGTTMADVFPAGEVAGQAAAAAWDTSNLNVQAASSLLNNLNPSMEATYNAAIADLGFPNLSAETAGANLAQALSQGADGAVNIADPAAGSQLNAIAQALGQLDAGGGAAAVAGGGDPRLHLQLGKSVTSTIVKTVKKQVFKTFVKKGAATTAVSSGGAAAIAAAPLIQTLGIGLVAAGAAVKLLRMKGLKSSRAQMLQDLSKELQPFQGGKIGPKDPPETPPEPPPEECPEGQVPDPQTGKCVPEPEPPPPPVAIKKPAIAVLDDDAVSIFRIRWRKKDKVDAQRDIYQAAQDAAIIGRNTQPSSDQVAEPSSEYRPFKADKKTFAQIKKKAAGKSNQEPLFAIDGSIIADLGNKSGRSKGAGLKRAGIGKERAKKLVRFLFKDLLRRERKPSEKMVNYAMRRLKIEDPAQQELVRAQLAAYGLAEPVSKKSVKESINRGWKLLSDGSIRRTGK